MGTLTIHPELGRNVHERDEKPDFGYVRSIFYL